MSPSPTPHAPTPEPVRPSTASWAFVAIAWTLVAIPLAWGMYQTLKSAIVLFH